MKNYYSLVEIQEDLYDFKISCCEIVSGYLKNISKNKSLNAFIEVYGEEALDRAELLDRKIKNGSAGKLAGLVLGIKDNICYKNHLSTAASGILSGFRSTYSATVVERLLKEDAIIIGRLNCDEFAMGSSNENSIYGPTYNPINNKYVPGGSSGASACSVKANLCQVALGTDTGGSIRQPAAFCGVMGLKPTYGLVSRHGLIAYASSFDQIGPIAKSAEDIEVVMDIISGKDDFDSTCVGKNILSQKAPNNKTKKYAVLKEALDFSGTHPAIKKQFGELIKRLKKNGHKINYVNIPILEHLVPTYYILTTAEASSNLSRYDGIKYGRSNIKKPTKDIVSTTRSLGFGIEVKRRILLGTYVLSEGYYDAYYLKAQKIRRLIKLKTDQILEKNDYILLPTTPNAPFKSGDKKISPTQLYYEDVFTVQANLSGNPSISFPIGKIDKDFFASAQIIGKHFSERDLLNTTKHVVQY